MVKSNYWTPVHFTEWFDRLKEAKTRAGTTKFSIVYRFYSTIDGPVRYVGRSDSPFSREASYYYGIYEEMGGRVTWVDFMYITGPGRFKESYEEECRQYHRHQPDLNSIHPKRRKSWKCPVCELSNPSKRLAF